MPKRYDGLLGLRGIGATMIIAYHMYLLNDYVGASAFGDRTVGIGGVFVQLFFMLSSFSLMCGYAEKIKNGDIEWGTFYKNRFIKLAPTFYTALIAHLLLNACAHVKNPIASIIGTASLLYALMPSNQESIVMAGWALGIEVVFYLFFPAFFEFTKTRVRSLFTLVGSILLYLSYNFYYGVGIENNHINIIYQLFPFALGAFLYHCISCMENINEKARKKIAFFQHVILFLLFVGWGYWFQGRLIVCIAFSLVIIRQIMYTDIFTTNRFVMWLGKISYEMYLFHMIVYRILYSLNLNALLNERLDSKVLCYIIFFIIEFLLTILFSSLYRQFLKAMFEKYFNRTSVAGR